MSASPTSPVVHEDATLLTMVAMIGSTFLAMIAGVFVVGWREVDRINEHCRKEGITFGGDHMDEDYLQADSSRTPPKEE